MKPATREWLDLAAVDLRAAGTLCPDPLLTAAVAFHSQQAVEKAFKAIIEEHTLPLPRSHDLERLLGIVREAVPLALDEDRLDVLNQVYVSSRYPMEVGILPTGRPTPAEARQMYAFAQQVVEEVASILGWR